MRKRLPATQRRNNKPLLMLVALFLAGIVAAVVMYVTGWHPFGAKNYGELVQPPKLLADIGLQDVDGKPVRLNTLRGRWTLVYFGSATCPNACEENLYKMRQLMLAQGREAHRVRRLLILTDPRARDWLHYALKDYAGTEVWMGSDAAIREVATQFTLPTASPLDNTHRIYLIDPLGYLMMSYPADGDLRQMNKDLGLLLRLSQVG